MKTLTTRTFLLLTVTAILAACNGIPPTAIIGQTISVATDTSTEMAFTETNTPIPTNTAIPIHSATPLPNLLLPTEISISVPGGIVYYYFVNLADYAPPKGSVVVMPDNLILASTQLEILYGSDVAADLRSALEAVLKEERNFWLSDKLQINQLSFNNGHVDILLEGEYYAVAPVVLTAARAQILMTLFANSAVQSATVAINGDNIANISISHSMDAKPDNYAYTRAEIETFMAENASDTP